MKKLLKLSIVVLLAWLFVPMSGLAAGFKDVSTKYTFYDEISFLSETEVISGFEDGTFRPNNPVTRVQAAIMIGRALKLNHNWEAARFTDVDNQVTGATYIAAAQEAGIIKGFSDGSFRPYETVTRGQMAMFLDRAFTMEIGKNNPFKDVSQKMAAYQSILNVTESKVAAGYADYTYRPNNTVTRGQFSAFMARALQRADELLPTVTVKFLDVGQGDATYIEYPNGKSALIDAGPSAIAIDAALRAENIKKIDTFIATHPDPEHIGGAAHVIQNYGVTKVVDNGKTSGDKVYTDYLAAIIASNAKRETAQLKDNITDDPTVTAKVLYTNSHAETLNDGAIVIMLTYGNNKILLAGDASTAILDDLVLYGDIEADILKISYDGAQTAISKNFIDIAKPWEAVLAYGEVFAADEMDVVKSLLQRAQTKIYSTYEQDTITFTMNKHAYSSDKEFLYSGIAFVGVEQSELTPLQKQKAEAWLKERRAEEYGKTTDFIYQLDDQLYILSRGWQPTPDYIITIPNFERTKEQISIFVDAVKLERDTGVAVPQITHYPYMIVKINLPSYIDVQFINADTGEILE